MRVRRRWSHVVRTLTPPAVALLGGLSLLAAACGSTSSIDDGTEVGAGGAAAGFTQNTGGGDGVGPCNYCDGAGPYGGSDGGYIAGKGNTGGGDGAYIGGKNNNGGGPDGAGPGAGFNGGDGVGPIAGKNSGGKDGGGPIAGKNSGGGDGASPIAGFNGGDGAGPIAGFGNGGGPDGSGLFGGSDGGGFDGSGPSAGFNSTGGSDGGGFDGSGPSAGFNSTGGFDGGGFDGSGPSAGFNSTGGFDGGGFDGSGPSAGFNSTGGGDGGGIAGSNGGGIAGSDGGGIAGSDGGGLGGSDGGGLGGGGDCPPSPEVCNGIDDDCNGVVDDPGAAGCTNFLKDADGDGFGVDGDTRCLCAAKAPYTAQVGGDCDDTRAAAHPGAAEACNGLDDDCNALVDEVEGLCPCKVISSAGHAYQFCTTPLPWAEAEAACQASGYHLATIENASEQKFISTGADLYSHAKFWIGINDRAQEGTFAWASGIPVNYTNWEPGEPNNAGDEDCGQINRFYPASTWNDEPCGEALPYICRSN